MLWSLLSCCAVWFLLLEHYLITFDGLVTFLEHVVDHATLPFGLLNHLVVRGGALFAEH